MDDYYSANISFDTNETVLPCIFTGDCPEFLEEPKMNWRHWIAMVCYGLVFLLGVPGNALVVWVTAFQMPRSVNAMWFLNLAVADMLCCLSLPLLMVPLARDQHWPFGLVACKLLNGLIYMVMFWSVLLLMLISLDRWLLVSRPAWCHNWRHPNWARWVCLGTWVLALLGSIPQFTHMREQHFGKKVECVGAYEDMLHASAIIALRFVLGFLVPFFIICVSHWTVYLRASQNPAQKRNDKSSRILRITFAVVLSFFLCCFPLHIVDVLMLINNKDTSDLIVSLRLAQKMTLCLAYFNSCLNPLLYVCLSRGFRQNMSKSLRGLLYFVSEEPSRGLSMTTNTRSTSESIVKQASLRPKNSQYKTEVFLPAT